MAIVLAWLKNFCRASCWLTLAATATTGSTRGYLAEVGPAALRFQEPPPPRMAVLLPPLPREAPDVSASTEDGSTNASPTTASLNETDANIPPWPPEMVPGMEPEPAAVPPTALTTSLEPTAMPRPTGPVISPQMLLDYFRPIRSGTNALIQGVTIPVQFIPPTPIAPPSSSATYRVQ